MEIISPYNLISVKFQRNYPGYIYRREIVDDSEYGGDGNLEMVNCYSSDTGQWIGDAKTARFLCKKLGIRQIQNHSLGFNEGEQKWYGWSHRAICGFGVGDKLFEEDFGNDKTPFIQHGKKTIVTLDEANQAAICFSRYVS